MTEQQSTNIGQTELHKGRLMTFMGAFNCPELQSNVQCFIDVTDTNTPRVFLDLEKFGVISYGLQSFSTAYFANKAARFTLRQYEDLVLDKHNNNQTLTAAEQRFYYWILSR